MTGDPTRVLALVPALHGVPTETVPTQVRPRRSPGRPSDLLEPWPLEWTDEVERLARTARNARLDAATGFIVVVERSLISDELDPVQMDFLDRAAQRTAITGQLSGATAVYLRQLRGQVPASADAPLDDDRLMLPSRLSDRLIHAGPLSARLDAGELAAAVTWECAAAASAATMTEWALRALLGRSD